MGLSERVSNNLFLENGVYSLWSRDAADPVETGKTPGNNMYGTHPFFMAQAYDQHDPAWYGVFSNQASAQDWYVTNIPNGGIINLV